MHAACCSLHTLQLDCACAASLATKQPASTSNDIAKILMIKVSLGVETESLALSACRLVDGGAQSLGKLQCIVVGPEMQEEQPRLLVQHVAVDRGHVDAVRPQGLNNGIDFVIGQNEVAGDGSLAA